jgi:hypothetical protein
MVEVVGVVCAPHQQEEPEKMVVLTQVEQMEEQVVVREVGVELEGLEITQMEAQV